MTIELAQSKDKSKILKLDKHCPPTQLGECIWNNRVYVLKDGNAIVGVLRYSLFWQSIPFLDLLIIDEDYRGCGHGTAMIKHWEKIMKIMKYKYLMTSTQADETAWQFYEKLGFKKVGVFLPPEQDTDEWIYVKEVK